MATYVMRDGVMVSKTTGTPMLSAADRARGVQAPQVMDQFTPYACPITGKEISDRSGHRENLKVHNCVEAKELGSATNGEIRNPKFAKKRGLEVSDKYKDQPFERGKRNDTY
jgi:hypothetical protein